MVYSTCSMSPYEDEAVIAELLRQFKGQLELVDAREFVPVFKARPGLSDWYVIDDHMAIKKEIHTRKEVNKKAKVEQKARDAVTAATAIVADAGVVAVAVAVTSDESSSSVAANVEVTLEVTPVDDVVHMVQSAIEEEKKILLGDDERDIYTSPVVSDPLLGTVIIIMISVSMFLISVRSFQISYFFCTSRSLGSSVYFYITSFSYPTVLEFYFILPVRLDIYFFHSCCVFTPPIVSHYFRI